MLKTEVRLAQCFVVQANADVCPGLATALGADQAASKKLLVLLVQHRGRLCRECILSILSVQMVLCHVPCYEKFLARYEWYALHCELKAIKLVARCLSQHL